MKRKSWVLIVLAIGLVLLASACTRSASRSPVATATPTSEFPFPLQVTENPMKSIISATQTAIASGAELPTIAASSTPEVQTEVVNTPEPPTATPIVVPTATPGHPSSYTLQKGEFPYCIARRFNVNPSELLSLNGLTSSSTTSAGQVLRIPQTNNAWPGERSLKQHPTTYTVVAGDTIYTIACKFGDVDPNAIILANALQSPYNLNAGDKIQIP